ncbi:MAG: T9SS type A sorting domain-containing protein, partial [candidate division WOR-3 bacterium]
VRPKLCYSPGAGPGGGAIFTGEGLLHMYWNAPWRTGVAEESPKHEGQRTNQTVCRGVLRLADGSRETVDRAWLLDVTGRKVMELAPEQNDIRHLAPGIYFLRSTEGGTRSAVTKVVIQH